MKAKLGFNDFKEAARKEGAVLRIQPSGPLRLRLWLAVQVARLAGWIAGVPTVEETSE